MSDRTSKCLWNSSCRDQKKTLSEQRQIVKSLVEILENEKNILELQRNKKERKQKQ